MVVPKWVWFTSGSDVMGCILMTSCRAQNDSVGTASLHSNGVFSWPLNATVSCTK